MVDSKDKQANQASIAPVISSGVLAQILLGIVWLLFTQLVAKHLGMTTLSLNAFLTIATITSVIVTIIVTILCYHRRKDVISTAVIFVLLAIFGVFIATAFTVGIGFMVL